MITALLYFSLAWWLAGIAVMLTRTPTLRKRHRLLVEVGCGPRQAVFVIIATTLYAALLFGPLLPWTKLTRS
jgi:hypothetical protein